MDHSITLTNSQNEKVNTWDDWHMIPNSRPVVNPPEVITEYVKIPGADGTLDFTEKLAGRVIYGDRSGSWEFSVDNGYQEWQVLYDRLLRQLHGKFFTVVLEDEPAYQYSGRLKVNEWRSEKINSVVTIDYVLSPYKKMVSGFTQDWLWDDLTVSSGIYTIYYGTFNVDGSRLRNLYNPGDSRVPLTMHLTDMMTIKYYGDTKTFGAGLIENCGLFLEPGDNFIEFIGNGNVTISYDRGDTI